MFLALRLVEMCVIVLKPKNVMHVVSQVTPLNEYHPNIPSNPIHSVYFKKYSWWAIFSSRIDYSETMQRISYADYHRPQLSIANVEPPPPFLYIFSLLIKVEE